MEEIQVCDVPVSSEEANANLVFSPSAEINLNQWFNPGDQAYIIVSSCMVLLMIPGLGSYTPAGTAKIGPFHDMGLYGSFSIIVFQWYFWGYSLAFSSSATNGFIGNLGHFGLIGTLGTPSPGSPLIQSCCTPFTR